MVTGTRATPSDVATCTSVLYTPAARFRLVISRNRRSVTVAAPETGGTSRSQADVTEAAQTVLLLRLLAILMHVV